MTEELIQDTSHEGILILTLNRPDKRNALSLSLLDALLTAITTATQRILILEGNGPIFSAGLDLTEIKDPTKKKMATEAISKLFLALHNSPLITISALNGPALAGGAGLLLASDFALATPNTYFSFPEIDRGIVPALVSVLLIHQLPKKNLHQALLLAEKIPAKMALALGLINQITNDPFQEALDLAHKLLAKPPHALQQTKKLLRELSSQDFAALFKQAITYHTK